MYRVLYGKAVPTWERRFPTRRAAHAFAKYHKSCGDKIFSVRKVRRSEGPQSITASLKQMYG